MIFGIHTIESVLKHRPHDVKKLYLQKNEKNPRLSALEESARDNNIHIEFLPSDKLSDMTKATAHQGAVADCRESKPLNEGDLKTLIKDLPENAFILVLDGVTDPHNLGACLRSADAAGVHAVIAPKDRAASLTPIVQKVASGATETVPFVQVTNIERTLEMLKEQHIWVYGASEHAEKTLFEEDLKGSMALVMGAEGAGLRRLTQASCDFLVKLPMAGSVSSLNVSVATGICLFEVVRQRRYSTK